jgi:hypothetical protein
MMRAARAPKSLEESVKKTSIPLVLAGFLLLAACSKSEQPVAESPASTRAAAPVSSSSPQPSTPASPERIAEIEASGKTGLWATVNDVCVRDIRSGVRTFRIRNHATKEDLGSVVIAAWTPENCAG